MPKTSSAVQTHRFDQMATMINDRVDDPAESGVERYVGLEHLDADSLRIRRWGDITDVESTKLRFKSGDIIFGKRRVYQRKLAVADFEGICSAHAMVLRARSDVVLPEFLPFFMQSDLFMERALAISVGSLSPTINWTDLAAQEFPLPTIDEQRRLLVGLTAAQAAVAALTCLRDQVSTLRMAAIYQFESQVHAGSNLGDLVTELESGSSPPSTGEEAGSHDLAVLKVSAVGDWEFVAHEAKAVAPGDYDESVEVHGGDLLIARANADPDSVGRSCLVDSVRSGLMLSDKTWRAHLSDAAREVPYGVLAWTKCRAFRTHVRNQLNGTDAKNISKERFLAGPAPLIDGAFKDFDAQIRRYCAAARMTADRLAEAQRCYQLVLERAIAQ